jgi:hypothetical protein
MRLANGPSEFVRQLGEVGYFNEERRGRPFGKGWLVCQAAATSRHGLDEPMFSGGGHGPFNKSSSG